MRGTPSSARPWLATPLPAAPLLATFCSIATSILAITLPLAPPPAAGQPVTDIIANGSFESGFVATANPDPFDGSSPDELPSGWLRMETFAVAVEDSMIFQRTDNGPSRRGANSLGFTRTNGGTSGDWTAVRQELDLDSNDCSALVLALDVLVENHNLEAGGRVSPAFEWPILVQLDYTTSGNATQVWRHGWYLTPPGDSITGPIEDPGTGLIPVFDDSQVPPNTWTRHSFNLLTELPQVASLDRITVGGAGWDFDGAVDNVRILCTPRALSLNGRRFEVQADWRTSAGTSGRGRPVQLTEDSGYFWFFNPDNVELQVKVLDACVPPFDRFWVFAAGLTNVEVVLTVTDTLGEAEYVYTNPLGRTFETLLNTDAFDTCELVPQRVCIDFGPPLSPGLVAGEPAGLVPGAVLFRQQGIEVSIHQLRMPSGGSLFDYGRIVGTNPPPLDFGEGQMALLRDFTLAFDFEDVGFVPRQVTFELADLGGFENLSINGSPTPIYVGELTAAPCPQAGVTCDFEVDLEGRVRATLTGPINELRIGGQELFLDTVCAWR